MDNSPVLAAEPSRLASVLVDHVPTRMLAPRELGASTTLTFGCRSSRTVPRRGRRKFDQRVFLGAVPVDLFTRGLEDF
jgi:hypothetical protein